MNELIASLKQRKLVQWALAYVAAAFALLQGVDIVAAKFGWPAPVERFLIIAICIGFFVTLLLAWYHGEHGAQRVTGTELLILALLLAIGGGLLWKFAGTSTNHDVTASSTTHTVQALPRVAAAASAGGNASPGPVMPTKSVAVLPLSNESGEQDKQYFSDGLSEDLINALSQFTGLKVISRNSSFQFREAKQSSAAIGRALGVAHLLEGSVRRLGDEVRITVQLVNAADGSTLWSQRYDRPYKDLFALQDDITRQVTGALKAELLGNGGELTQSDRPPGGDLAAYNAYLQGAFLRRRENEADLRMAIAQFMLAVRLDPEYALAYAALAETWTVLGSNNLGGTEAQQAYAQARAASGAALHLAPALAAAHAARAGLLLKADFDWSGAQAEYQRALQLAPNDAQMQSNWAVIEAMLGHVEQAVEYARRALQIDPLAPGQYRRLSFYLWSLGRLDEARTALDKAFALEPGDNLGYANLVLIEIRRGDAAAALVATRRVPPGHRRTMTVAHVLQIGPDRAAADAALRELINDYSTQAGYQIAEAYALRRDPNNMFKWLDRAWAHHDGGIVLLLSDPFLLRYRDDPRFATFCQKVGLPTTTDAKAMP